MKNNLEARFAAFSFASHFLFYATSMPFRVFLLPPLIALHFPFSWGWVFLSFILLHIVERQNAANSKILSSRKAATKCVAIGRG